VGHGDEIIRECLNRDGGQVAFGDYLGVTVGLAADQQYRWPNG
jgi:hypothetical protein